MKKKYLALFSVFIFINSFFCDTLAWWNATFDNYRNISLTNGTYTPTNYTVNITANASLGNVCGVRVLNSTENDVVFALHDEDGNNTIDTNEIISFKVDQFPTDDYQIYYNNDSEVSCKNMSYLDIKFTVFDMEIETNATLTDTVHWTPQAYSSNWYVGTSPNVTTGKALKMNRTASGSTGAIVKNYTDSCIVEVDIRNANNCPTSSGMGVGFFDGRTYWQVFFYGSTDFDIQRGVCISPTGACSPIANVGGTESYKTTCGSWYHVVYVFNSTGHVITVSNDTSSHSWTRTSDGVDPPCSTGVQALGWDSYGWYYDKFGGYLDNLESIQVVSPQPTGSLQSEESEPTTTTTTTTTTPKIEEIDYCELLWIEENAKLLSNDNWCLDNETLARNVTFDITLDANKSTINSYSYEVCQFGCDNVTNSCRSPQIIEYGGFFVSIIVILILAGLTMKLFKRW